MKGRVVELVNSIANLYERKHGVYSAKDIADLKNRFQGTAIKGEDLVEELLLNWQSIEKLIIDKQPIKDAKEIKPLEDDMILVKGGLFVPSFYTHAKIIKDILVGTTPVKQSLWNEIMLDNPSHWQGEELPVESITWYDALIFCNALSLSRGFTPVYKIEQNKLVKIVYADGTEVAPHLADFSQTDGYRLPTEVEWEWFARGGRVTQNSFAFNLPYAGSDDLYHTGWYAVNARKQTHAVGLKKANALGLYDCCGNVGEWCFDTHTKGEMFNNFIYDENETNRRIKGGGWNYSDACCAINYRGYKNAHSKKSNRGLRIVRSI